MICYTLYAHGGGGGGRGLETRNEFACGRNGGSASNSMYIFRVSINPTDLPFFVVVQSICATSSAKVIFFCILLFFILLLYFLYVCMYVLHTSYICLFVRGKTASKYQLSGPLLCRSGGSKQPIFLFKAAIYKGMYLYVEYIAYL